MNSPLRHDSAVDEQAALWAARLDGDVLEANERAELDAWLARSPAHRAALSGYCQLSADLEEQLPALVAQGTVKMPATPRGSRSRWTFPRVASVAFAAAAAIALVAWFARPAPQVEFFGAGVAQRLDVTLGDGTQVKLNANTSLRFENTKTERRIRLAGGEALFTVAKDRARPFIVQTAAGAVRVTGTIFNVRADPTAAALAVTVLEGSVEVRPGEMAGPQAASPFSLSAGDHLSARAGSVRVEPLPAAALEEVLAWREGAIVFNDVPIKEAAARVAQFHGRSIIVEAGAEKEKVGGRYSLDDWDNFLGALEIALPVKVRRDLSGTTVYISPR